LILPDIYYKTSIMGRNSKSQEEKKGKLSITISTTNYQNMVDDGINKSQLINWLLEQHFNTVSNGK
jgi:hypothetical protein